MAPVTFKPGLSFAKVAASAANDKPTPPQQSVGKNASSASSSDQAIEKLPVLSPPSAPLPSEVDREADQTKTLPVSVENINQLAIAHESTKAPCHDVSRQTSAAPSIATFPNDEKESIRPDDSASLKGGPDDNDMRHTGPTSSTISSNNSDIRAFHDQLDEIASADQGSHDTPSMRRISPAMLPHNPAVPPFQTLPYMDNRTFSTISGGPDPNAASFQLPSSEPDEKLIEALFGKDRLWLLKLEQDIIKFIHNTAARYHDVQHCSNSFYRMLAHRVSDYYLLAHTLVEGAADRSQAVVRLLKTPGTRLPPPLISFDPQSGASDTSAAPAPMKILRRDETRPNSTDGNAAGNDGDSGSDASRSKQPITREERTARYEAARLRIMGSARPSEVDLNASAKDDESRSNLSSGKRKNPKRTGTDDDDDFEARSAYSTYRSTFTTPGDPSQYPQYYSPTFDRAYPYAVPMPAYTGPRSQQPMYPPAMSPESDGSWPAYPPVHFAPTDLAQKFNQSMSLVPGGYAYPMQPMMYPPQHMQSWTPGSEMMYPYPMPYGPYMPTPDHAPRPQSFHPPHFNAQSQSFVPGQQHLVAHHSGVDYNPDPRRRTNGTGPAGPSRQDSFRQGHGQHNKSDGQLGNAVWGQPHRDPVQGSQRSQITQQHAQTQTQTQKQQQQPQSTPSRAVYSGPTTTNHDSIHKWATPPSLPAKPPTPASMSTSRMR